MKNQQNFKKSDKNSQNSTKIEAESTTNNPDLLLRIRNDKNTIGEVTRSFYKQKLDELLHQI